MKLLFKILFMLVILANYVACANSESENLYTTQCASCHSDNGASRAPDLIHLSRMTPKSIFASLKTGKMQIQGAAITDEQKIALAEYITQRKYEVNTQPLDFCEGGDFSMNTLSYSGWGGNLEATGFIPDEVAQLPKSSVPNLKLKWSFGFDGGVVTRTKPAILGDFMIFGSEYGEVYCLNMETGCVKWRYEADANVRGGIAISEEDNGNYNAFFADFGGNTYSLDAKTGELNWKTSAKNDPNNAVTGTVAYFDGMVYIPMTSMEVVTAGNNTYECCKSSGQLVALDAKSGKEVWRHRVITEQATERGINEAGAKKFGPSGAPVWSSPTIDAKRGLLYIGTGENNSNPPTTTSDAIQALDLKTGEIRWNFQATSKDAYISACADANSANCPDPPGPDVDFGMSPLLTTRVDGSEVLVVGQKSGVVHCLNPDTGEIIWQKRIGRGGALGGLHWGMATDGNMVYAANSDWYPYGSDPDFPANPGLFALDLMDGEVIWQSTSDLSICKGKPGCYTANSAAPTLIDGVVFSGSLDGHARAYDAATGEVLWDFDTNKSYQTINGVKGQGGAIDGPGPVVANGMVFFNSGYGLFGQMPGNVLLAFSIE